jgi:hypothetical protein
MCQGISARYEAAVHQAAECSVAAANQCTKMVAASFSCRCQIFVEGDTNELVALDQMFWSLGCATTCEGTCPDVVGATCGADPMSPTGGRCAPFGVPTRP